MIPWIFAGLVVVACVLTLLIMITITATIHYNE